MADRLPLLNGTANVQFGTDLNPVVIYDDVVSAKHAVAVLNRSVCEIQPALLVQPNLWRIDFLEDFEWRTLATVDVLNADMLIISLGESYEMRAWFHHWLISCFWQKQNCGCAVVALLAQTHDSDTSSFTGLHWLDEAAREAHLDFFFYSYDKDKRHSSRRHEVRLLEESNIGSVEDIARIGATVELINRAAGAVDSDGHSHWGINE